MPTMKAVQIAEKGAPLTLVERAMPEPGSGQVRIKVKACGVCHSDSLAVEGLMPGIPYPIIPGHEVAGVIDAVGEGVTGWSVGTRAGVGWFGGNCGHCEACRRGELVYCANLQIPGVTKDGGYAEAMIATVSSLVRLPDDLSFEDIGPMLCAGVTTFNGLRNSGAQPGDLVAVLGIGGLGHLGVQFARKMGFHTVAIARGADKGGAAKQLGAHIYLDSEKQDVGAELKKLGGARAVLATITNPDAMSAVIPGLGVRGTLLVVGIGEKPMQISAADLITNGRSVKGHASGTSIDSEDTLRFSLDTGVRPIIETLPLAQAAEAYNKMMSGKAKYRMVLTM